MQVRGVSKEEKRERMLDFFFETVLCGFRRRRKRRMPGLAPDPHARAPVQKGVFHLKELEKLVSKEKGIRTLATRVDHYAQAQLMCCAQRP